MNLVSQKMGAPRLLTGVLTIAALAVSSCASHAQKTAPAPVAADIKATATDTKKSSVKPAVKPAKPVEMITPLQWINRQPRPIYKPGHTMPRLTYYGYYRGFNGYIEEITANWNYTMLFPYLNDETLKRALTDPKSDEAKMIAMTLSNPKKYPLGVVTSADEPLNPDPGIYVRDAKGELVNGKTYSPLYPQSVLDKMAELRARPLRELRKKVPINMILNGGEYGLGILGFSQKDFEKDPKLVAAKNKSGLGWFEFVSKAKGREMDTTSAAVRKAVPDRSLYIYYATGQGDRNRYGDWYLWGSDPKDLINGSDLPSTEYYYKHFNNGYLPDGQGNDILTRSLNAVGFQIKYGKKNSYDWLSGGWEDEADPNAAPAPVAAAAPTADKPVGELDRTPVLTNNNAAALVDPNAGGVSPTDLYTGFLKCLFIAGTIGGNAGYYQLPGGGFDGTFPADKPKHYLPQMTALSQVQALFSYVEDDLRQGDLLPGANWTAAQLDRSKDGWPGESPYKGKYFPINGHRWTGDQPAYEFPTEANDYPSVRVLARKTMANKTAANKSTRWLVTAWAADGLTRPVKVTIPELGTLTLLARPEGSVYRVTLQNGKPQMEWLDPNGMTPTVKGFAPQKVTTEQINAAFKAPTKPISIGLKLQFDAAKGVKKDKNNAVLSWKPSGALPDWTLKSPAKGGGNALWVQNAVNGLPAIRLDEKRLGLVTRALAGKGVLAAGPITVFAVYASTVPLRPGNILETGAGLNFINGAAPVADRQTWQIRMAQSNLAKSPPYLALGGPMYENGELYDQWLFGGDIAEILVYEGGLSLAQQTQTRLYLQAKYRL